MHRPVCLPSFPSNYVVDQSPQLAYDLPHTCHSCSIPTTTLHHIARAARQGGAKNDQQASELTFVARTPESLDEMRLKAPADSFG